MWRYWTYLYKGDKVSSPEDPNALESDEILTNYDSESTTSERTKQGSMSSMKGNPRDSLGLDEFEAELVNLMKKPNVSEEVKESLRGLSNQPGFRKSITPSKMNDEQPMAQAQQPMAQAQQPTGQTTQPPVGPIETVSQPMEQQPMEQAEQPMEQAPQSVPSTKPKMSYEELNYFLKKRYNTSDDVITREQYDDAINNRNIHNSKVELIREELGLQKERSLWNRIRGY